MAQIGRFGKSGPVRSPYNTPAGDWIPAPNVPSRPASTHLQAKGLRPGMNPGENPSR